MKHIFFFMIVGVICGCVLGVVFHRMSTTPEPRAQLTQHAQPRIGPEVMPTLVAPAPVIAAAETLPAVTVQGPITPPAMKKTKASVAAASDVRGKQKQGVLASVAQAAGDPVIAEPVARDALNYVGIDPDAEAVWVTAINDPSLSSHDRQNLIEDLNENGISDPDHPTMDDLPLIESRISLIEQLAPDSMDEVNYAAFQEAYKDLWNMHDQLVAK